MATKVLFRVFLNSDHRVSISSQGCNLLESWVRNLQGAHRVEKLMSCNSPIHEIYVLSPIVRHVPRGAPQKIWWEYATLFPSP